MKKCLLFFCVLLLSCDKKGPTEYGFLLSDVRFDAGTRYTYAWALESRDSAGNLLFASQDTLVVIVETTNDAIGGFERLTRLRGYSLVDSIGSTIVWYQNDLNGCTEVAYEGAGHTPVVFPKKGTIQKGTTLGVRAHRFFVPLTVQWLVPPVQSDSFIIREDPRIVFKYPLSDGQSWTSFASPWLQTREVVGSEFVQIEAGFHHCVKIKTDSPLFGNSLEWFDYVDTQGLVRRLINVKYTITGSGGDSLGTAFAIEQIELLSLKNERPKAHVVSPAAGKITKSGDHEINNH